MYQPGKFSAVEVLAYPDALYYLHQPLQILILLHGTAGSPKVKLRVCKKRKAYWKVPENNSF